MLFPVSSRGLQWLISMSDLPVALLLTCNVLILLPLRYSGKLMKLLYFVTTSGMERRHREVRFVKTTLEEFLQ